MNRPKQPEKNKMCMLIPPTGGTMTISKVQRQCDNSLPFEERKRKHVRQFCQLRTLSLKCFEPFQLSI